LFVIQGIWKQNGFWLCPFQFEGQICILAGRGHNASSRHDHNQTLHCKEKKNLPFALGSCTLNRLAVLVEILGAPVLRFMLNLRLANDILPTFALLSGMSVGGGPRRNGLTVAERETEELRLENQKGEGRERPGLNVEGTESWELCCAPLNASGEEATFLSITTGASHSLLRKSKFRCVPCN
jgi:hypothetical protein